MHILWELTNMLNILSYFMFSRNHGQPKQTLDVTQILINLDFKPLCSRPSLLVDRSKETIENVIEINTENWRISIGPRTIQIVYIHMNPETHR